MTLVYVLLVAHFIGDFVCQTDWMADNKSKRWDALAVHVAAYSLAALIPVALWAADVGVEHGYWFLFNAGAHFAQDAITSRINARLWQANERHWFFVGIGADQLLHYVTLLVTAGWWLQ